MRIILSFWLVDSFIAARVSSCPSVCSCVCDWRMSVCVQSVKWIVKRNFNQLIFSCVRLHTRTSLVWLLLLLLLPWRECKQRKCKRDRNWTIAYLHITHGSIPLIVTIIRERVRETQRDWDGREKWKIYVYRWRRRRAAERKIWCRWRGDCAQKTFGQLDNHPMSTTKFSGVLNLAR